MSAASPLGPIETAARQWAESLDFTTYEMLATIEDMRTELIDAAAREHAAHAAWQSAQDAAAALRTRIEALKYRLHGAL